MLLLVQLAFTQDYWLQKDTVKGPPKSAACAFVLENKGFAVTGMDAFEYKRKMYSYRSDQDDWDDELSLGGEGGAGLERVGAVSFAGPWISSRMAVSPSTQCPSRFASDGGFFWCGSWESEVRDGLGSEVLFASASPLTDG